MQPPGPPLHVLSALDGCRREFSWLCLDCIAWRVRDTRISWGRVKPSLVGSAALDGTLHLVVDFEDDAFGAVFAELFFFFLLPNPKRVHNVIDIVACDTVEVEVGSVEFAAEQEAPLFIPA